MHRSLQSKRILFLFLIGYVLFNYPLVSLFDLPKVVWGIPILYGYLFLVWALLIALVGITISTGPGRPQTRTERKDSSRID